MPSLLDSIVRRPANAPDRIITAAPDDRAWNAGVRHRSVFGRKGPERRAEPVPVKPLTDWAIQAVMRSKPQWSVVPYWTDVFGRPGVGSGRPD